MSGLLFVLVMAVLFFTILGVKIEARMRRDREMDQYFHALRQEDRKFQEWDFPAR